MTHARFLSELRASQTSTTPRLKTMVMYSGTPVYRFDWWSGEEYMLTLSTDPEHVNMKRLKNAPVLADHYRTVDRVVGVVEDARLEGRKIVADTRFADTPDVEEIWAKVKSGIIRNVSIEAFVSQTKDTSRKGDKMRSLLAIDWEPQAVALVPVGADPGAQMMSASEHSELWLPEDLYSRPKGFDLSASVEDAGVEIAETGAASEARPGANTMLLSLLLRRRTAKFTRGEKAYA